MAYRLGPPEGQSNDDLFTEIRLPAGCIRVRASIDTIWPRVKPFSRELLDELRIAKPGRNEVIAKPSGWDWAYRITTPTPEVFQILREWEGNALKLGRCDVAVDFLFGHWRDAWAFLGWCAKHLYLRWRKKLQRNRQDFGIYWIDSRGRGKIRRTLAVYIRPDDVTVRVELRFQNTDAVRRNRLDCLLEKNGTLGLSPQALFDKHVAFREADPRYVERRLLRCSKGKERLNDLMAQYWQDVGIPSVEIAEPFAWPTSLH